jgi:hypothetical protein
MRILRAAFFLSVIAVLAPSPPESEVEKALASHAAEPSQFEMLSAAGDAVTDIGQFCQRQPDVCHTAMYLAARLEAKAKYSVRQLYEWASDTGPGEVAGAPVADQAAADDLMTGSTVQLASSHGRKVDHGTLTGDDLVPAWRPSNG